MDEKENHGRNKLIVVNKYGLQLEYTVDKHNDERNA